MVNIVKTEALDLGKDSEIFSPEGLNIFGDDDPVLTTTNAPSATTSRWCGTGRARSAIRAGRRAGVAEGIGQMKKAPTGYL